MEPAAPTSLSTYWPAPRIGESPARPGIFQDSPLVVVTPQISPSGDSASKLVVPQKESGSTKPSSTIDKPAAKEASWKRRTAS